MKPSTLLAALSSPCLVQGTAVFAHFMVGNTKSFQVSDWENNMQLAQEAHIDAFALNMAYAWPQNDAAVALAFQAAANMGFQLFFSFDYAGNGPWPADVVTNLIQQYGSSSNYFHYQGRPFVSTFEGPGSADDWPGIKAATNCFFVPSWSSVGAGPAIELGGGVADGLFSWAAWPYSFENMTTYVDASYIQALNGKPYMMPVSPWFYTNLPGYKKNWLWNGDDLWYQRWQQAWYLQPEFIEIITWNDFGESHYIGPLDSTQYDPFTIGQAPFNYAEQRDHDGWRVHLPYLIDTYKNLQPTIGSESLVAWFRLSPGKACSDGNTTGNTATQLQIETEPWEVLQDRIYVTALLSSPASLFIGDSYENDIWWDQEPVNGIGLYHGNAPMDFLVDSGTGIRIRMQRRGTVAPFLDTETTARITSNCPDSGGFTNFNPYVLPGFSQETGNSAQAPKLSDQVCVSGTGAQNGNFSELCEFTCQYGYCPVSACVCTNMGNQVQLPTPKNESGYPANGDANYAGLCSFACNYGFCPPDTCSLTPQPPFVPTNSPFSDPACTAGTGSGAFAGLCSFSCNWGFCPMHSCLCTATGFLNVPPAANNGTGYSLIGDDSGLCQFACSHGYCPEGVCSNYGWPVKNNYKVGSNTSPWRGDWVAFGDSYAAGIGAGTDPQNDDGLDPNLICNRGTGAYPRYLAPLVEDSLESVFGAPVRFAHAACSGAVMNDIANKNKKGRDPQLNLGLVQEIMGGTEESNGVDAAGWATLSITGNDAMFAKVARLCFFLSAPPAGGGRSGCLQAIQDSLDKIDTLQDEMVDTFHKMLYPNYATRSDFLVIINLYPHFFNADADNCRDPNFSENGCDDDPSNAGCWLKLGTLGLELNPDLRTQVNDAVDAMNNAIVQAVTTLTARELNKQFMYLTIDSVYNGHRFCDSGLNDPVDGSWFFTINSNDEDPNGNLLPPTIPPGETPISVEAFGQTCNPDSFDDNEDWGSELACLYAKSLVDGAIDNDPNFPDPFLPQWIAKAMHPKSIANSNIAINMINFLNRLPRI